MTSSVTGSEYFRWVTCITRRRMARSLLLLLGGHDHGRSRHPHQSAGRRLVAKVGSRDLLGDLRDAAMHVTEEAGESFVQHLVDCGRLEPGTEAAHRAHG